MWKFNSSPAWGAWPLALTALFTGCGGGGDVSGSGPTVVTATLSVDSIASSYPSGALSVNPVGQAMTVRFGGEPNAAAYAKVIDSGSVLLPAQFHVRPSPDGSYPLFLYFSTALPAGTYTGTFSVQYCVDTTCTPSSGSVPYTITVTPGLTLTATINGVEATITGGGSTVGGTYLVDGAHDGDTVVLRASQDVEWTGRNSGAFASNIVQDAVQWSGTVHYGPSTPGQASYVGVDPSYRSNDGYFQRVTIVVTP